MAPRNRLAPLLALACALAPAAALAQYGGQPGQPVARRTQLTAIAGYQLNSDVDLTSGHLSVGDTPVYGAAISVETLPGAFAELLWLYSDPSVRIEGVSLYQGSSAFNMPSHYFQLGGTKGVQRGRMEIFGGATLGAALFMPEAIRYGVGQTLNPSDTWRFAFTLGAGLKVDLAKHLGLRFDARVAAPVLFQSASFYAGTGGSGLAVSGGIPLWQWNFTGGLVVTP